DAEDRLPSVDVGCVDDDLTIEAARAEQGRVEDVGTVRRRHHDHPGVALEAVELDQELVQGLLPLVVAATEAGATVTPDGVDLVDEDNGRCALLGLLEEVTDTGGDRKSTRLNSSHVKISYAVFCLKKKNAESSER